MCEHKRINLSPDSAYITANTIRTDETFVKHLSRDFDFECGTARTQPMTRAENSFLNTNVQASVR